MSIIMILVLALSAGEIEEIILEQYERSQVLRVIPPSHPAAEYEWRIEPRNADDLRGLEVVGDKVLAALGTPTNTPWEHRFPRLSERDATGNPAVIAKKANVGCFLTMDTETQEARFLVFDPERIPTYSEEGSE